MVVRPLTKAYEGEYESFLASREEALFYHSLAYRDFLHSLLGCDAIYLVALDGGRLRGVLPVMYRDGPYGRLLNSLPYFGSNGGIVAESNEARRALSFAYNEIAAADEVCAATYIGNPFDSNGVDDIVSDVIDERIGQFTRLSKADADASHLMDRFEPSGRRNIRKAQKGDVVVERDPHALESIRSIHEENMSAIGGRPKTKTFFDLVPAHFAPGVNYDVYVARLGGETIAGLLLFYAFGTVEYYIPATAGGKRSLQPLAAILLTAMTEFAGRGYHTWNWGGTWKSQEGVYRFKKKWAAEERPYKYSIRVNAPGLFEKTAKELWAAYPDFFVVPYFKLTTTA